MAIRPAAIISRTEGTRTRATTSWIFGAARAACSSTARRLSRRRAPAWRRSWSASGEPKRRERSIAATRVASSLPGTRARSERRATPSGIPQESSATVSRSSSASGPSPARASCSSPAAGPRPEPALTASRSSASGSAANRRRWRRRASRSSSASGTRKPATGSPIATSNAVRPGAAGAAASAARPPHAVAGELRRQHRGQRQPRLQAGAAQALRQPQPQRRPGRAPAQAEGQRRQAADPPCRRAARERRRSRAGPRAPPAARRRSLDHPREALDRDEAEQLKDSGKTRAAPPPAASRAAWR